MKMNRFAALALAVSFSGFLTFQSFAEDDHSHAASHDHESMQQRETKITEALSALSPQDQKLAAAQRFCPVMTYDRLGSMGTPVKMMVGGKPVFLCCEACQDEANADPTKTLKTVDKLKESTAELAKLPMETRAKVEAQKYCAVINKSLLGSMGVPIALEIDGKPVYLCCAGCTKRAQADPAGTLAKAEKLVEAGEHHGHEHDHK